ncbi:hypothetical protein, partial [Gluconacetobacter entanii]|uniref:hypothetical protein n=1 Tax=Gluconacetobacter entanii TaxID=108528 RepID=UPI001ABFD92D
DGQQQRCQKGGITTTGYSLSSPQSCPNGRDHLNDVCSEMAVSIAFTTDVTARAAYIFLSFYRSINVRIANTESRRTQAYEAMLSVRGKA